MGNSLFGSYYVEFVELILVFGFFWFDEVGWIEIFYFCCKMIGVFGCIEQGDGFYFVVVGGEVVLVVLNCVVDWCDCVEVGDDDVMEIIYYCVVQVCLFLMYLMVLLMVVMFLVVLLGILMLKVFFRVIMSFMVFRELVFRLFWKLDLGFILLELIFSCFVMIECIFLRIVFWDIVVVMGCCILWVCFQCFFINNCVVNNGDGLVMDW